MYRNGALLKTLSAAASGKNSYENDPGKDGTYVYRVDKQYKVGSTTYTIPGKEFIFVRNTAPVDESIFIRPPAAPELSVRIADGYPILSWTPQEGGGEPEGYHIYRIDGGEQKLGGRYVYSWKWYGYDKDWTLWGNEIGRAHV